MGNPWNFNVFNSCTSVTHSYLRFTTYFVQNDKEMSKLQLHQVLAHIDVIAELSCPVWKSSKLSEPTKIKHLQEVQLGHFSTDFNKKNWRNFRRTRAMWLRITICWIPDVTHKNHTRTLHKMFVIKLQISQNLPNILTHYIGYVHYIPYTMHILQKK